MFKKIARLCRALVRLVKRVIAGEPRNEYEQIAFNALYSAGIQLRKGMVL